MIVPGWAEAATFGVFIAGLVAVRLTTAEPDPPAEEVMVPIAQIEALKEEFTRGLVAQTTLIESLDAKYEMQIEQLDMLRAQVEEVSQ